VWPESEITVECAPGTLTDSVLKILQSCGVNRVSLGVQSFVDREAASVGRLHQHETVIADIARLRAARISNINVDLIAGLPHQTCESWNDSLNALIDTGVPHASIYMLEIDEDSRLGRELIAGGQKYHAHFVPDEDLTAELYENACERLNAHGIRQYEISNFARPGFESKHNLKYWTRQPYLGFGVDAHSMLASDSGGAVRFGNPDSLERYLAGAPRECTRTLSHQALEETFFLGLRLNVGIDLQHIWEVFGAESANGVTEAIRELTLDGLLEQDADVVRLTRKGRLLSNEVFQKFISVATS
jgi:oxygen-independent coproporphyrinogen-3 oxidase